MAKLNARYVMMAHATVIENLPSRAKICRNLRHGRQALDCCLIVTLGEELVFVVVEYPVIMLGLLWFTEDEGEIETVETFNGCIDGEAAGNIEVAEGNGLS